nr:hypothetical protein [Aeribacillus pallidus]
MKISLRFRTIYHGNLQQNGYTYANTNPVMLVDPDGHWVWLAINAGFAVYDGYKAYKSGKGWKGVATAATFGFIGGGRIKAVKKIIHSVYTLTKNGKVVYVGRKKILLIEEVRIKGNMAIQRLM